ncbi:MAG: cna protein [Bacillales bacterium]|nr:cna protein [Bacillales bacterium]
MKKVISLFLLTVLLTTGLPINSMATVLLDQSTSLKINDDSGTKEIDSNKETNEPVSDPVLLPLMNNRDFIESIQTGESQLANDGPELITKEVPNDMKEFFIGEKDLHELGSYSEQQELAAQSDEWQKLKEEKMTRSSSYRLSENGSLDVNVARYTPSGLHYTHDKIIRWQIDGEDVFCIQEGVFTEAGILYDQKLDINDVVSPESRSKRLRFIGYFGYYNQRSMENYALTQMLVWDEMGGSFINYGTIGKAKYDSFKATVDKKIAEHDLNPSWHNTTVTVKAGEEIRVRDTHNRFSSWNGTVSTNTAGVSVRKDGNDLVIAASANSNDSGVVRLTKYDPNGSGIGTTFAYTNGTTQDLSRLHLPDPGIAALNVKVEKQGHAAVRKLDETTGKPLAGAVFRFTTNDGKTKEITTNNQGIGEWRDLIHDQKVTIEEIQSPNGYVINSKPQTITIKVNETVTATFDNKPQKGQLELSKTVETGVSTVANESDHGDYTTIEFEQRNGNGFGFKIRPTEDIVTGDGTLRYEAGKFLQADGEDIVWTTGEDGKFTTDPLLFIGKYEVVEVSAPAGVVLLDEPIPFSIDYAGQTVDITSSSLEVENFLQDLNIYGRKMQEVLTGWEDGKAVVELENAKNGQVFALRLAEELLVGEEELAADTTLDYSVVEEGKIAFEGLKLPNQTIPMYIQELYAGPDHVMDDTKHHFVYDPENNDVSFDIQVEASQDEAEGDEAEEDPDADSEEDDAEGVTTNANLDTETPSTEEDIDLEEEPEEDLTGAIINRLARAGVQVIKTDGMDQKPLESVAFDLYRVPAPEIDPEEDSEEAPEESEDVEEDTDTEENEDAVKTTNSDEIDTDDSTESEDSTDLEGEDEIDEETPEEAVLIGTFLTDENGEINIDGLPTGHYLLVESQELPWYHANEEEYTFEVSPENDGEVIVFEVENHRLDLEVETLFVETETGSKVLDPTKDNHLTDFTWIRGGKEDHEYYMLTQYIKVNKDTKEQVAVVSEDTSSFVSTGDEEHELPITLDLPANTMESGYELVATHMIYDDPEMENLVNEHFDLENEDQTVLFLTPEEEPELPVIPKDLKTPQVPSIPQAGNASILEELKAVFSNLF